MINRCNAVQVVRIATLEVETIIIVPVVRLGIIKCQSSNFSDIGTRYWPIAGPFPDSILLNIRRSNPIWIYWIRNFLWIPRMCTQKNNSFGKCNVRWEQPNNVRGEECRKRFWGQTLSIWQATIGGLNVSRGWKTFKFLQHFRKFDDFFTFGYLWIFSEEK